MSRTAGRDLKGKKPAGFRFTPSGESEWSLALDYPLHLVPGGGLGLVERAGRSAVQPMDESEPPEIWKVGGDGLELSAILRYQRFPRDLMDALRESADGLRLDYYPRLEATNWFFPVQVVGVGEELRAEEDPARFVHGEYQWREVRIRHLQNGEGNNGDSFEQLLTGNLLLGPRLHRDSDSNGVADAWVSGGPATGTTSIVDRAQEIDVTGGVSGDRLDVHQRVFGILEGDEHRARIEREIVAATDADSRFAWIYEDDADAVLASSAEVIRSGSQPFTEEKIDIPAAPPDATQLRLVLRSRLSADNGSIQTRWRDSVLTRTAES